MWNTSSILVTGSCTAHQISILDVLLKSLIINRLVLSKFILLLRNKLTLSNFHLHGGRSIPHIISLSWNLGIV